MQLRFTSILALALVHLAFQTPALAADSDAGLAAVGELAQINGQALACQDMATVAKAKKLMLAHAPKTPRYGTLFEESTNSSYLAQVRGTTACPDSTTFSGKLDVLAKRLQEALPAAPTGTR